jgi:His-Xaa-Ser system protein HxsD
MTNLDGITVSPKKDAASFDVDTRIYPLDAVLGTAYVFINRAYVHLDQPGKDRVRVTLSGKERLDKDAVQALCGDFLNELLGQVLRDRTAKKYGRMREALLAKAIFAAAPGLAEEAASGVTATPAEAGAEAAAEVPSLDDLPDENADYLDDPYGIAVPWEEKYGDKKSDAEG